MLSPRSLWLVLLLSITAAVGFGLALPAAASGQEAIRSGYDSLLGAPHNFIDPDWNQWAIDDPARTDDGQWSFSGGLEWNFYGQSYSNVVVSNNGFITFGDFPDEFMYFPEPLADQTLPMIAPFWDDVDTQRDGNALRSGTGTIDGHATIGFTWPGVAPHGTLGVYNTFQLMLIDRSDLAPGDFDIEFNYGSINWSGVHSPTRVGWTSGISEWFELPGSGVDGALLDSKLETGLVHNRLNSDVDGRYVFNVRGGSVMGAGTTAVPEPATIVLIGTGLLWLVILARRRRPAAA